MRLTEFQVQAISQVFRRYFLENDHLWLFGSRVDKQSKGGDIDLYIETSYDDFLTIMERKIEFLSTLKQIIGEQKIDVVINAVKRKKELRIYDEAKTTGIKLL